LSKKKPIKPPKTHWVGLQKNPGFFEPWCIMVAFDTRVHVGAIIDFPCQLFSNCWLSCHSVCGAYVILYVLLSFGALRCASNSGLALYRYCQVSIPISWFSGLIRTNYVSWLLVPLFVQCVVTCVDSGKSADVTDDQLSWNCKRKLFTVKFAFEPGSATFGSIVLCRVPPGPYKSLKVLKFHTFKYKALISH